MDETVISTEGEKKLLQSLNRSKALRPDEFHHRVKTFVRHVMYNHYQKLIKER